MGGSGVSPAATMARAKMVAQILSEHGLHVSSPDDGDLDDVERERWDACVRIVKALEDGGAEMEWSRQRAKELGLP